MKHRHISINDNIDISWECYFMNLAHNVKIKSPDPIHKVGCVLVSSDNLITSTGYNDLPKTTNTTNIDWCHKDTVRNLVVDAEMNCILYSDPMTDFTTSTLYISSCPKPCNIKYIATTGLKKIYYSSDDDGCCDLTRKICHFYMIELIHYKPRDLVVIGKH